MNRKAAISLMILLVRAPLVQASGSCSLAQNAQAGASRSSSVNVNAMITVGRLAGLARTTSSTLGVGALFSAQGGFTCFMSTNAPLGVSAMLGTGSVQKMVPSSDRTMMLEWEASTNPLPVTYDVYTSTNPIAVLPSGLGGSLNAMSLSPQGVMSPLAIGLSGTSAMMTNLNYFQTYYWQVLTTDQFGRNTASEIFSFSIAPVQDHLIAAPNPFHPGNGNTSLMFNMDANGTADMDLYSLPDGRHILHRQLAGLLAGVNVYVYDGRENNGQLIPNGVFTIRLTKHASSTQVETFKIIAVH